MEKETEMVVPTELIVFVRDFAIFFAIYLIVALSLNLEYGYAGIPNFGKVLAVAGGAFTVSAFPGRVVAWLFNIYPGIDYTSIEYHIAIVEEVNNVFIKGPVLSIAVLLMTLVVACLVGAALGFVASYPAIRLREDYLAMTLLVMGEAIQVIGYNYTPIARGNLGAMIPDPFRWAGELRYMVVVLFVVFICILSLLYVERLVRTPLGRMLKAIRENEDAAESLGKDVARIRMKTIVIASMLGSLGGAIDAFKASGVISTMYHRVSWTFWIWVMVILGGAGNNKGVLIGTFAVVALRRGIDYFKEYMAPFVPFSVVWLDYLLLGVMIILIQMYRPEGLVTERPTPTLSYNRLKKFLNLERKISQKEEE